MPLYGDVYQQWVIGYQYYGGIATWANNGVATVPSARPVKTAKSKPGWRLAADLVARPDAASWGDSSWSGGWQDLPAHKNAGSKTPPGANEVFSDGSARWVKAKEGLYFIHSWNVGRELYFYQDDLGALEPYKASLKKVP